VNSQQLYKEQNNNIRSLIKVYFQRWKNTLGEEERERERERSLRTISHELYPNASLSAKESSKNESAAMFSLK
jgi:hypothetical protein